MTPPPSSWVVSRGARIAIVGSVLGLAFAIAWWLKGRGDLLTGLVVLLGGAALARWCWGKLVARAAAHAADAPMVSLVLLLKQPRYLEAPVLAEILRAAWDVTFSVSAADEKKSENTSGQPWIIGQNPIFMVNTGGAMFVVHNHERLYFGEVENLAEKVPDLRLRTIILEHRAWLSVDAMGVSGEAETAAAYKKISRALAELADDTVLGLFQPEANRLTPWEPSLEAQLRSGENLDELFALKQAPVVQISNDDPRMLAAVTEARQRWPEFVAAFGARRATGNYAVKAPVTRGDNTEFIWLEVIGLEPEFIHGKLANDPVNLEGLKLGDQVEVAVAELNDWTYRHTEAEDPAGLFTVKVLTQTYQRQVERARGAE
jgi:uncharacterized protein YegJ (DUF2314 family)